MTDYFYIKQFRGRTQVFRVYKREPKKCTYVCGFPYEGAAAAKVKELNNIYNNV